MIYYNDAKEFVLKSAFENSYEEIGIKDALNRVLYEDICSPYNLPLFDKSAMDGYAYIKNDSSKLKKIVEVIPAGSKPKKKINFGECSKIMTGAMIPKGADTVIRVEYTKEKNRYMEILRIDEYNNICYSGENIKKNDILVKKNIIRPQEIAVLSSVGINKVKVHKKPKIGIIATGSEIREPGEKLQNCQIFNSNTYSLKSQIEKINVDSRYYGICRDEYLEIKKAIKKAMKECSIVLISGGSSVGDFDFVQGILEELSVDIKFKKIAVKPGKPTIYGVKENTYLFGLPGNPVSTFIIFELLVKPLIFKIMGHNFKPVIISGEMVEDFKRRNTERIEYRPIEFVDNKVFQLKYQGSGHVNSLAFSNALMIVDIGVSEIKKGQKIDVRLI